MNIEHLRFYPENKTVYHVNKYKSEEIQLMLIGKGWRIIDVIKKRHKKVNIVATRRFTI
jgi:hypothetical protein